MTHSMRHTDGPWSVHGEQVNGHRRVYIKRLSGDRTEVIAECFEPEFSGCLLANARLLAASTQLLKAVHGLLNCPDMNLDELDPITLNAIDAAHTAIDFAESQRPLPKSMTASAERLNTIVAQLLEDPEIFKIALLKEPQLAKQLRGHLRRLDKAKETRGKIKKPKAGKR